MMYPSILLCVLAVLAGASRIDLFELPFQPTYTFQSSNVSLEAELPGEETEEYLTWMYGVGCDRVRLVAPERLKADNPYLVDEYVKVWELVPSSAISWQNVYRHIGGNAYLFSVLVRRSMEPCLHVGTSPQWSCCPKVACW